VVNGKKNVDVLFAGQLGLVTRAHPSLADAVLT